jgi:nondiscriminating glutamyl-tRNA synthetase
MSVRVRFAPSPTGHLHVGNVRTALYNWLFARQKAGSFILRIEDTDLARSETHYERQLLQDLCWLGLDWDEGVKPEDPAVQSGDHGPYRQTERFDLYREEVLRLLQQEMAYYCFCPPESLEEQRKRQLEGGVQTGYSGRCRSIPPREAERRVEQGEAATIRLKVREGQVSFEDLIFGRIQFDCSQIADFVLLRSDGSAQYNLACVVDDARMEITHVIRGEGHLSNTPRQLLLYEALAYPVPRFAHLSTILGKDGAKLSKRHGATSIEEFRRQGYLPEALINYLALLGWAPEPEDEEILSRADLTARFDLMRVNRSPAVFDPDKLNWVSRSHLKELPAERLARLALPFFQEAGFLPPRPTPEIHQWLAELCLVFGNYVDRAADFVEASSLVFRFDPEKDMRQPEVQAVLASPGAAAVIAAFANRVRRLPELDLEAYREAVMEAKNETGQKGKNLFHPIRVALTGRSSGPELDKLIPLIERGSKLPLPAPIPSAAARTAAVLARLS